MTMKKCICVFLAVSLLICLCLTSYASAKGNQEECIDEIKAYLNNPNIFDLGLFEDSTNAVQFLSEKDPTFAGLCQRKNVISALECVCNESNIDSEKSFLVEMWLDGLTNSQRQTRGDYTNVTITLPNKTLSAKRYTGNLTPSTYPNASNYSSASLLSGSSYRYNCHAYGWYYRGNVSNVATSDLLWFDSPTEFYSSPTCYSRVYTPAVGDLAVYWYCACNQNRIAHTAYITSVASGTAHNQVRVKSKWGIYGVYSHILSDCPYYQSPSITHPNNSSCSGGEIRYYRVGSHSYVYESINAQKHKRYCTGCGYIVSTQNHSFVSMGTYSQCSQCGYRINTPINLS